MHTPLLQGTAELRGAPGTFFYLDELIQHDRRLDADDMVESDELVLGQRHHGLERLPVAAA